MRSLLIDTSSFFMSIGILEDEVVLASFHEEIRQDMASKIIPTIELLFDKVTFSIDDIDKIFIINGPGSFTGIRVGVTVAKTIAWALKKKIVPISSLELLATTPVSTTYRIPVIDARRGFVYAGVYDQDLKVIQENQYMPFEQLRPFLKEGTLISRDEIEGAIRPTIDMSLIVKRHMLDEGVNPHQLNPNYLKLTEAEENKLKEELSHD